MASSPRLRLPASSVVIAAILRCLLPAILFLPWCCQSLLTNLIAGGLPTNSVSSSVALTTHCKPSKVRRKKISLGQMYHSSSKCFLDDDGVMEQEESRHGDKNLQQQQQQQQEEIYLFSLNWIKENDPEYFRKKDVRRLWEWKDTALGDGRDFFVPKPKTLMALQKYLLDNIPNLTECSIISNCARLEVLCCYTHPVRANNINEKKKRNIVGDEELRLLARGISNCFVTQLNSYQNISKNANALTKVMMQLPINADRPESLLTKVPPTIDHLEPLSYYDSWWDVTVGTETILTRLCKVSAGMGHRPRRPDRSVVFRPFSSRDAHVLLQLKRTRENISFCSDSITGRNSGSCMNKGGNNSTTIQQQRRKRKVLPTILDCALRAGKAARNPAIVPEIEELRELTSAESSACSPSDLQISQRVANAALEKGILPLVKDCALKLHKSTQSIDQQVTEFRRSAFELLLEVEGEKSGNSIVGGNNDSVNEENIDRELRSWLNRRLHEPTVNLRSRLQQHINNEAYDNAELSYMNESLDQILTELHKEHHRLQQGNKKEIRSVIP